MTLDHNAIRKAYPDVTFIDDSEGAFKEDGTKVELDQSLVDAARVELDKLNYRNDRVMGVGTTSGYTPGYLDVRDQLDQLYHDMRDGKLGVAATTGSWYVGITSVKNNFPKPS